MSDINAVKEADIRKIVEQNNAVFLGILHVDDGELPERIEDVVLFRLRDLRGSCLGIKVSQVNDLNVLLALSAARQRWFPLTPKPDQEVFVRESPVNELDFSSLKGLYATDLL